MVITYSQTDIENLSFKWIIVLCPCVKMANDIGLIQILFQWHVMGEPVHAPRQSNSMYVQMVRWSI